MAAGWKPQTLRSAKQAQARLITEVGAGQHRATANWTAAEETPPGAHAKRRLAIGADTVELLRAHRLAQAKDALAYGTTLAADAYRGLHPRDPQRRWQPLAAARPAPPSAAISV